MKLKYYLRGIGLGLLVAFVLYSTAILPKYKMTDEEIIKRAKELGMEEQEGHNVDLSALTQMPMPTSGPEEGPTQETTLPEASAPILPSSPAPILPPSLAVGDSDITGIKPPEKDLTEPTAPDAAPPVSQSPAEPTGNGKVSITIPQGMNSDAFAAAAKQAGLVEDAKDFDEYLMANGYAKELRAGTYLISIGSSYEEIAKRVTAR